MGRIFHNFQIPFPGNAPDRVHVARQTAVVHGHNRPGTRGDSLGDGPWIDVSILTNVGEHGRRSYMNDRIDCGAERERRGDDFVASLDSSPARAKCRAAVPELSAKAWRAPV
jgi:hypothetical protein